MIRDIGEILGSQQEMLDRLEVAGGNIEDDRMAEVFSQHSQFANRLLMLHKIPVIKINYHDVISDPPSVANKIAAFLEMDFDVEAGAAVVDPSLYRQRVSAKS